MNCGSGFLEYVRVCVWCRLDAFFQLVFVLFLDDLQADFVFFVFSCSELMYVRYSTVRAKLLTLSIRVDPHALTNTHCGHSFCCFCIIRHILDSLPHDIPNPALAPELIRCPSCDIDGSPPGSPSPSPSPGSRRGLVSRQTTLASVVSSVYETLLQEEVEGWVPPDETKRIIYDERIRCVVLFLVSPGHLPDCSCDFRRANTEALIDWNACWSSSGDFSQLKEKLARR